MKVKQLTSLLKKLDQEKSINLASDEEWNTIFSKLEINFNTDNESYVLFGLSGSEIPMI
jgi:hypothetical protein